MGILTNRLSGTIDLSTHPIVFNDFQPRLSYSSCLLNHLIGEEHRVTFLSLKMPDGPTEFEPWTSRSRVLTIRSRSNADVLKKDIIP